MTTRSAALAVGLAMALAFASCGTDDTQAQVDCYCTLHRRYEAADAAYLAEQVKARQPARLAAAVAARAAQEAAAPPSLVDDYLTVREYKVMSGEERADDANRDAFLLAQQAIDAFAGQECALG